MTSLKEIIEVNLIEAAKEKGIDVLYDVRESSGNRLDLEAESKEKAINHMKEKNDNTFSIIAFYYLESGEKKDIVSISNTVEYQGENYGR